MGSPGDKPVEVRTALACLELAELSLDDIACGPSAHLVIERRAASERHAHR